MNYIYCNKSISNYGVGIFRCWDCHVGYDCPGYTKCILLRSPRKYIVELVVDEQICKFFKEDEDKDKLILTLNYLPFITPSNLNEWINKLLHMKAFS